ncbi:MAG: hypothetical protein J6B12_05300, partial [Clostridia bacterium]|nr:hypothetical protein [Clostridia bacterium]
LKLIRFPVHELALIMSIALRFIPTLMEETERIIAQYQIPFSLVQKFSPSLFQKAGRRRHVLLQTKRPDQLQFTIKDLP